MLDYNTAEMLQQLCKPENKELWKHIQETITELPEIPDVEDGEKTELVLWMLASANEPVILTAYLGTVANRLSNNIDLALDIILELAQYDLLDIDADNKNGKILVQTSYDFEITVLEKHIVYVKEDIKPVDLHDYNFGSMILGGYIKGSRYKDTDNICLDHLNRMNQIELSLDIDLLCKFKMLPTAKQEDTEEWKLFRKKMYAFCKEVVLTHNNKFNIIHKYDTRGRCYSTGYYIDYQGSGFQKAVVQLANKELVTS